MIEAQLCKKQSFFVCSCINASKWVLIKVLQHLPQDQGVRNEFKIFQNPINTHLRKELKKEKKIKNQKNIHKKPKCKDPGPNIKDLLSLETIVG